MLKPWTLTIWATCSLTSVSNVFLDVELPMAHAISVLHKLSGCLFLSEIVDLR